MTWTKAKQAIAISASGLLAAAAATSSLGQTNAAGSSSLTLRVNPEVFIRNVMARAEGTMNTAGTPHSAILLDVLKMEGFDLGTNYVAFDTQAGEITTRNTPGALKLFREIVEDLNRDAGESAFPRPGAPPRPTVLVTCGFYKLRPAEFDRLGLALTDSAISENGSRFWAVAPDRLEEVKRRFQSAGLVPFQSPRVLTAYGCTASVFVGDASENVQFKCLPLPFSPSQFGDQVLELKVQASTTGKFTGNPAGDWEDFAGRTNCAVFARVGFDEGGGLVLRARNPDSPTNDLVLLVEAKRDAKPAGK